MHINYARISIILILVSSQCTYPMFVTSTRQRPPRRIQTTPGQQVTLSTIKTKLNTLITKYTNTLAPYGRTEDQQALAAIALPEQPFTTEKKSSE